MESGQTPPRSEIPACRDARETPRSRSSVRIRAKATTDRRGPCRGLGGEERKAEQQAPRRQRASAPSTDRGESGRHFLAIGSAATRPTAAAILLPRRGTGPRDRKSTRLNSSHLVISYA